MTDFRLSRDAFGKLVFSSAGETHAGVTPVRAFPIAAPEDGIAIVNTDGRELVWIDRLDELPEATRALIRDELAQREFLPEIRRIRGVSTFAVPSTWEVETDRGDTALVLKGEEDIRRIGGGALIVTDLHGVQYLLRDPAALDRASRKLLDRFL